MTTFQVFSFGTVFIAGNLFMYACSRRAKSTELIQNRLVSLASSIWRDAVEANQYMDPCLLTVHNQILELAALAPSIAAGMVIAREDETITLEQRTKLDEFLNRNAWVLPYIFTAFLSLRILQVHAKPWAPLAAARGLQAWLLIRCFSDDRGSLRFSTRSEDAVHQVEDFVRLDTRRQADRLMSTA